MSKFFENEMKNAQKEDFIQSEETEVTQKQNYGIARKRSILPKGNFAIRLK